MIPNHYARWYSRVVWLGVLLNMIFVVGTFFFPLDFLEILNIPAPPTIWIRTSGMLLCIISIFYIPGAVDPMRYRWTAILAVVPSRAFGSTFFLTETLGFGWPMGFLSIALVDLAFGLIEGVLLYKAFRLEPTA
jgi:ribose/xylose/arabinose/galactoside ABC-type transport system permease subunit